MAFEDLKYRIEGLSPLLMHNEQLADPLGHYAQELGKVSKKRSKTLEDHKEMSRIEWYGSLYLAGSEDPQPCIPAIVMEACLRDGAKKERKGKDVTAGLMVTEDALVDYSWPGAEKGQTLTIDEMWENPHFRDRRGVRVQRNKIFRTRPLFKVWSAEILVRIDTEVLNAADIIRYLQTAGRYVGLMDWRPRFGRFEATVL